MPIIPVGAKVIPVPPKSPEPPVIDTASSYGNRDVVDKLATQIDGMPYLCTYYNLYIRSDDPITNSGDISDPTLKQYVKIHAFEMRLTSPLSNSQTDDGTFTLTGTANIYPVITPILGDVFIGTVEGSTKGLFEISDVKRLSEFKESAWAVTYMLIKYVNSEILAEVDNFVISELVLDKDLIGTALSPLRTLSENQRAFDREENIKRLVTFYYNRYFDRKYNTFFFPNVDVGGDIYDPFLVGFWNKYIGKVGTNERKLPFDYDVKNHLYKGDYTSLFDVIGNQDSYLLPFAVKSMQYMGARTFSNMHVTYSISNIGIDFIVYPRIVNGIAVSGVEPAVTDDYYIFSKAFYDRTSLQTPMELLVNKIIDRGIINYSEVVSIMNVMSTFTEKQLFYVVPLLIVAFQLSR